MLAQERKYTLAFLDLGIGASLLHVLHCRRLQSHPSGPVRGLQGAGDNLVRVDV